jgi:cytochrome c-type biogenesis protein CcmH/NrfF
MSSNPFLTNVLLSVIAALLLVMVIQNGMTMTSAKRPLVSSSAGGYGASAGAASPYSNPTVNPNAPQMAHSMFFQAVKGFPEGCNNSPTLDSCDSPAAQAVKKSINDKAASGANPRQVFDFIVETWGEQALTDQAREIRNQRVRGQSAPR